jgi:hypothetical protein
MIWLSFPFQNQDPIPLPAHLDDLRAVDQFLLNDNLIEWCRIPLNGPRPAADHGRTNWSITHQQLGTVRQRHAPSDFPIERAEQNATPTFDSGTIGAEVDPTMSHNIHQPTQQNHFVRLSSQKVFLALNYMHELPPEEKVTFYLIGCPGIGTAMLITVCDSDAVLNEFVQNYLQESLP